MKKGNKFIIETNKLSFTYLDKLRPGIHDINLQISSGEFIVITGPSGSGKSTLIRTFNGLVPNFYGGKYKGKICVLNKNPVKTQPSQFADKVGFVFQNPDNQLFMTDVESEIAFGLENLSIPENLIDKRINEAIKSIYITELKNRNINDLSGGEKQKVAIASVIAMHPEILILDEPTSELDPKSAKEILELLKKLNSELSTTIIIVEHRLERIIPYADRIITLNHGEIEIDDKPENLFQIYSENGKKNNNDVAVPELVSLYFSIKEKYANMLNNIKPPISVNDAYEKLKPFFDEVGKSIPFHELRIQQVSKEKSNECVVKFDNVTYHYPNKKEAIKNISFEATRNEFIVIVGFNGSGKSTLLKHLNGLLKPAKGKVLINGKSTKKRTVSKLSREVGLMFQNPGIQFYRDTVERELHAIVYNYIEELNDIKPLINEMFDLFELTQYKDTYPRYLSQGEQQKASMAAALISKPSILALDEPTHGLDFPQKISLFKFLKKYCEEGNTVFIASHDIDLISKFATRIILMDGGRIISDGIPNKVLPSTESFQPSITKLLKMFPNIPDSIINIKQFMEALSNEKK